MTVAGSSPKRSFSGQSQSREALTAFASGLSQGRGGSSAKRYHPFQPRPDLHSNRGRNLLLDGEHHTPAKFCPARADRFQVGSLGIDRRRRLSQCAGIKCLPFEAAGQQTNHWRKSLIETSPRRDETPSVIDRPCRDTPLWRGPRRGGGRDQNSNQYRIKEAMLRHSPTVGPPVPKRWPREAPL
jgi:hypothetical protein